MSQLNFNYQQKLLYNGDLYQATFYDDSFPANGTMELSFKTPLNNPVYFLGLQFETMDGRATAIIRSDQNVINEGDLLDIITLNGSSLKPFQSEFRKNVIYGTEGALARDVLINISGTSKKTGNSLDISDEGAILAPDTLYRATITNLENSQIFVHFRILFAELPLPRTTP